MGCNVDWIKKPIGFLKVIALILLLIAFCLYVATYSTHLFFLLFAIFVFSGFFILLFWIFGYSFDNSKPGDRPISELVFLISYAILGIITGIILIIKYDYYETAIASAVFAILAAIVLAIDAFFTFQKLDGGGGGE